MEPDLYHYTDIYGLQGMVEKEQIWATDVRFLNDSSEQRFGEGLLDQVFDDCIAMAEVALRAGEVGAEEYLYALSDIRDTAHSYRGGYSPLTQHYSVICLTEAGDQLSQWRGYARDGYCLRFDARELFTMYRTTPATGTSADAPIASEMRRVSYGDDGIDDIRALVVREASACAARTPTVRTPHRPGHDSEPAARVAAEALFHKHPAFAEEREVRILIPRSGEIHTPGQRGMVPRLEIPLPRACVRSIMVGPNAEADLQEQSLISYAGRMRWTAYDMFAVTRSAIPYRG